ncbi:MAG: hypothetical protein ACR2M6_02415 [Vampirovibrionia bacterium]
MATPYNFPSGTINDISFGPARVFMDTYVTNSTDPLLSWGTDVGYIGEDGVNIEISAERRDITQGNPRLVEYSFTQAQSVMVNFTSIAWDVDNFARALGGQSNVTAATATVESFGFGGDPINQEIGIRVQHEMAVTGNTINVFVWRAMSESGFTIPFGQDEHQFEFSFKVLRSEYDWRGTSIARQKQLILVEREKL